MCVDKGGGGEEKKGADRNKNSVSSSKLTLCKKAGDSLCKQCSTGHKHNCGLVEAIDKQHGIHVQTL